MVKKLEIRCLGGFQAKCDGVEVQLPTVKHRALLAYLASNPGKVGRERLLDLLWSTRSEKQARDSLSRALTDIKKALEVDDNEILLKTRDSVGLDPTAVDADVRVFQSLTQSQEVQDWREACNRVVGPFLDGMSTKDPQADEWIEIERIRLRALYSKVLVSILVSGEVTNEERERYAEQLLRTEPLEEVAHRELMRVYASRGDRLAAIRQFEELGRLLHRELGIGPDVETQQLVQEIKSASFRNEEATRPPEPDVSRRRFVSVELPDEPSIAVLPFTNMSNDPEQEHFSDGITEDIITALSKVSALLVIARTSTSIYKGRAIDVRRVGIEQGVHYVLEGSVRKSGSRVRVSAQLIDATTGTHLWAEGFDRELEDIFVVQDEITMSIVAALDVKLREGEQARFWSSSTDVVEAWECVRLGLDLLNSFRSDDVSEVMRKYRRALELDPNYAAAWALLGWAYFHISDDAARQPEERNEALEPILECASRAIECDPSCAEAYAALGMYYLATGDHDNAAGSVNKSVELAPNHASSLAISAAILNKCGQTDRALERIRKAMRLSPVYPAWFLSIMGQSARLEGHDRTAVGAYQELVSRQPDSLVGHVSLAAIYGELDRLDEATAAAKEVLRLNPDFSVTQYVNNLYYKRVEERVRFGNGLRKAGLPE